MAYLLVVADLGVGLVGAGPRNLAELVALEVGPVVALDFVVQLGRLGRGLVVAVDAQPSEFVAGSASAADSFGPAVLDFLLAPDPAKPFVVQSSVVDAAKVSKTTDDLGSNILEK